MSKKVKICGIKDSEMALFCARTGADFIGLNFSPDSPRRIDINTADSIMNAVKNTKIRTVFLFYRNSKEEITEILTKLRPDYIQYITREWPDTSFLEKTGIPLIAAIQVREQITDNELKKWPGEFYILDSYSKNEGGGTGESFNYELVEKVTLPFLVAGGLNPENVAMAIAASGAAGADVASGVEIKKGIKDAGLTERFIQNAKRK